MSDKKLFHCQICDVNILLKSKSKHIESKKHITKLQPQKETTINEHMEPQPTIFKLLKKAFKGYDKSYFVEIDEHIRDPFQYLNDLKQDISNTIWNELINYKNLKMYITVQILFSKDKGKDKIESKPYFNSNIETVLNHDQTDNVVKTMTEKFTNNIQRYQREGSNWQFQRILNVYINTHKYNPLKGSSYVPLPPTLANTKAVVNIKNNDNKCFMWSVLAQLHPDYENPNRVSKYKCFNDELNFINIEFPVKIKDITLFEKQNNISISCFGYDKEVYPLYVSQEQDERHVDLLYYEGHYCLIRDFNRLMYSYNKHNEKKHFCRYCLHAYSKKELLVNHISDCYAINGTQKVSLPDEDHKILKFTNYDKQLKVPFVIYADFESITEPIESINSIMLEE